jgi:hypothetical protein
MKNLEEFKKHAVVEITNTNNAWGFGGTISDYYTYQNLVYRKAKFCYRHAPSHTENLFYELEEGLRKEISKKEFLTLIEKL